MEQELDPLRPAMNNDSNKIRNFKFSDRRFRLMGLTVGLLSLFAVLIWYQNKNLQHSSFTTGYVLLGCIVFLTAFNIRKKLPFLPAFGSAAMWMQLHIYVGFSTFLIFAFHIGWKIPNGLFEGFLAGIYMFVALSGVYGLYITRTFPRKLASLNEEVIYERIPTFRSQIAAQTRELILNACESSDVLAKFYVNRLVYFLERPRGLVYMLSPTGNMRRRILTEIRDLDRYLAPEQRNVSRQLKELVQKKDDLDFHSALQGKLKLWMFLHIGFTYSLLIISILHGVMAHAFSGGMH